MVDRYIEGGNERKTTVDSNTMVNDMHLKWTPKLKTKLPMVSVSRAVLGIYRRYVCFCTA